MINTLTAHGLTIEQPATLTYSNDWYNAELYSNMNYTSETGAARIGYNTLTPSYQ